MFKHLILAAATVVGLGQLPFQVQTASSSQNLTRALDQAGVDHFIIACSNPSTCQTGVPGMTYLAQSDPADQTVGYTQGSFWVVSMDTPNQPGATLNINGWGPMVISGTCDGMCILLAQGSPVNALVVH
jgi:hypothetical protein